MHAEGRVVGAGRWWFDAVCVNDGSMKGVGSRVELCEVCVCGEMPGKAACELNSIGIDRLCVGCFDSTLALAVTAPSGEAGTRRGDRSWST
jgi:hypothetical protein